MEWMLGEEEKCERWISRKREREEKKERRKKRERERERVGANEKKVREGMNRESNGSGNHDRTCVCA